MGQQVDVSAGAGQEFDRRVALTLAAAMFVLVVDTSLMNVSISAVVDDIGATVSDVQSAIALEALVSAAFILIGGKVADLVGRKRAYVIGLCGYGVGAIAMTLAQSIVPIIIFWAVVGGIGAALLLPGMQALIHGNFTGEAQKRVYALVGASAAVAAAVGPLIGGFLTTMLSWRVGFLMEAVIILAVLSGVGRLKDVTYTGPRQIDLVGAALSVVGMGGLVLGILVWQEGGEAVGALLAAGLVALGSLTWWLVRRHRDRKPTLVDPTLFSSGQFRLGISSQLLQQVALGGAMITLPIYLQMVLEYNALEAGLSLAPLSLSMFAVSLLVSRKAKGRRPSGIITWGFVLLAVGVTSVGAVVPRADSGWLLAPALVVTGTGLGLLVSQLNNYTLSPITEERVSEAAAVNSAAGSFGLSFGLAFAGAIMLAALSWSFSSLTQDSSVLPPADKDQVATALEDDAQVMSNTQLEQQLSGESPEVSAEVVRINTEARPFALRVGLLVCLVAALLGLRRLPADAAAPGGRDDRVGPRDGTVSRPSVLTRLG